MPSFGHTPAHQLGSVRKLKDQRRTLRKKLVSTAWVRLDGGFATRSCDLLDLSDSGVRFSIEPVLLIRGIFTLLTSRDAGTGRRARVKWRRGSQIGAEFL